MVSSFVMSQRIWLLCGEWNDYARVVVYMDVFALLVHKRDHTFFCPLSFFGVRPWRVCSSFDSAAKPPNQWVGFEEGTTTGAGYSGDGRRRGKRTGRGADRESMRSGAVGW